MESKWLGNAVRSFRETHSKYDSMPLQEMVRQAVKEIDAKMSAVAELAEELKKDAAKKGNAISEAISMAVEMLGEVSKPPPIEPIQALTKEGYSVVEIDDALRRDMLAVTELIKLMKSEGLLKERQSANASTTSG